MKAYIKQVFRLFSIKATHNLNLLLCHLVLGGQLYTDKKHIIILQSFVLRRPCILNNSFFLFPQLLESDDQDVRMSLLAVMLFDFQDRKFSTRGLQGQEEVIDEVRDMEEFLHRYRGENSSHFSLTTNKITNSMFLLCTSCLGLRPEWRRLWPVAGSKTTSNPSTASCRRT